MNPTGSTALALEIKALKAEIERLKEQLRLAQLENNKLEVAAVDHKALIVRTAAGMGPYALGFPDGTYIRAYLAKLCICAADILEEEEFGSPTEPSYGVKGPVHELIAELRRAAQ
jgi:hypothetical protein